MEGAAVDCVQGHAYVVHGITRLQVKHLRRALLKQGGKGGGGELVKRRSNTYAGNGRGEE